MQVVDRILALGTRWVAQDTSPFAAITGTRGARQKFTTSALVPSRGAPRDPRSTLLQRQCLKLGVSIFSGSRTHVRSLGFTSAIAGEGKTFLASATASAMAKKANRPVVLVDCNWENPSLHSLYDLPDSPGLAEWARGECDLEQVRHEVAPNLTVIPAGTALGDAISVTTKIASHGIASVLTGANEVLVADMPPVLTSAYASQLAQELDAVTVVVRAGATWDSFVAEAYQELENAQIEGVILNATHSHIPRWIQRLL